jgi:hypothetical protein
VIDDIDLDDLAKVNDELFQFVWNFRHGDNIIYNFEVLAALYSARDSSDQKQIFNKPITIAMVSIVEAILIDFLIRIDQATNHLPGNVDGETLDKIKAEIESKKQPVKVKDDILGEQIILRKRMYNYSQIVGVLQKYELFGSKDDGIYERLRLYRRHR